MEGNEKSIKSLYDIFFDICIIGGGASGLAAAISAMETNPTLRVCIVEKKDEIGKKILATGNGKCNITNKFCEEFVNVNTFLNNSGIMIKEQEEGRMYPLSEQASSVVELLKYRAKKLNIAIFTNCHVLDIIKNEKDIFNIKIDCVGESVSIPCNKVIVSCGGKAGPQFGTTGDGYSFAKSFGHKISNLHPVLTPIECEGIKKSLKGVRAKGDVYILKDEQVLAKESGEVQFTAEGLSGICIFNLSRHIKLEKKSDLSLKELFKQYIIEIDFLPQMEEEDVLEFLEERRTLMASMPAELYLASLVNTKLASEIIGAVLGDNITSIGNITYENLEEIAMLLKSSRYIITGAKGWKDAQCTSGGVLLNDINLDTMESKIIKDIYFTGELLDYDGPCGGFNLNHAWITGIKAGKGAANSLNEGVLIGE